MENKNNKMGIGILIGVLIALVIGLGSFIIYDKVLKDDNSSDNNTSSQENGVNSNLNSLDKKQDITKLPSSENDEFMKLISKYDSILAKYLPTNDLNSIPNQIKLYFLWRNLDENKRYKSFSASDLKEVANKYFDDDFKFENEDLKDTIGVMFKYNSDTELYESSTAGRGINNPDTSYGAKSYFVDSEYDNDTKLYAIKVKSLYTYCDDVCYITTVYGSADQNDLVLNRIDDDVKIKKDNAKIYLDCTSGGKDFGTELCSMRIEDAAYKLGSKYAKDMTYYFEKLDSGNFVLKSVK